jgi:hypothetical protein
MSHQILRKNNHEKKIQIIECGQLQWCGCYIHAFYLILKDRCHLNLIENCEGFRFSQK